MAMPIGIAWNLFLLVLLMLTSYVCIYLEFWKSRCTQPFVEIGDNCYFLSTNKAPTYDYYKVSYKGHIFSVPAEVSRSLYPSVNLHFTVPPSNVA
ncbi:uncharacterized protein LOC6566997 isoform X3 [Drosophila grimshawi]|uniref:uncharacterized protein LOC6566997 isoform X3 n=1 Tax=Drosophila grimshawi TaxID=7222 RepID=UPI001C933D7C|nr:uncharacterized protein LOC6566997 isoform X3 [Drosophila grimshawi]